VGAVADGILPRFIATEIPAGFAGLLIAAMMAAAISALSSGINSIASVGLIDILQRLNLITTHSNDLRRDVFQARVLTIGIGVVGTIIALLVTSVRSVEWNLVDLIHRFNHLFVAPLGVLMLIGIMRPKIGFLPAIVGFAAGVLASLFIAASGPLLKPFGIDNPISFEWIMPFSFVVSWGVSELVAGIRHAVSTRSHELDKVTEVDSSARTTGPQY